ncbi:MAG: glutathione reductase (NADPH) [Gammaproteobacteria bacterium]|jgi:glutathione reductase (NADPH)
MSVSSFDFIVIGGGSGGIACARRAASYGAKVLVVESGPLGGTCVNVGCVPKKVMWMAAHLAEQTHLAKDYGFTVGSTDFDWPTLKAKRDAYIGRLNGIYAKNLGNSGVETVLGQAAFVDADTIKVNDQTYSGKHILIATGGYPWVPDLPGAELGISSDGFFELEDLPKRALVVGAGYIATELAGVLNGLGSQVTLALRKDKVLRGFDSDLQEVLTEQMLAAGIDIKTQLQLGSLTKTETGSIVAKDQQGQVIGEYDSVVWAIGRLPNTASLNIESTGIELNQGGFIETDGQQSTPVESIHAVGDVTGRAALTPVAIAAGRRLADRLFNGDADAKFNYELIPTVMFTHPPIGTVGLSESDAIAQYGEDQIKVYKSRFVNMFYAVSDHKPPTFMKLVCQGENQKVVGCHIIGDAADEILQGFAVAITMGATKQDFDNTLAIHPTSGEELVTLV